MVISVLSVILLLYWTEDKISGQGSDSGRGGLWFLGKDAAFCLSVFGLSYQA